MKVKIENNVAIIESNKTIIQDASSAVDFVMSIKAETGCTKIALNKSAITEDFFILSNGLAGEVLQKFVNYGIKFAIYGDFSKYTSKPLHDFIYESNQGHDVYFVKDANGAIEALNRASAGN